jgi:hypothetical protein
VVDKRRGERPLKKYGACKNKKEDGSTRTTTIPTTITTTRLAATKILNLRFLAEQKRKTSNFYFCITISKHTY